jgi:hypothetical protein
MLCDGTSNCRGEALETTGLEDVEGRCLRSRTVDIWREVRGTVQ